MNTSTRADEQRADSGPTVAPSNGFNSTTVNADLCVQQLTG